MATRARSVDNRGYCFTRYDNNSVLAFMAEQRVQFVGDTRISNVWYRIIERYMLSYFIQIIGLATTS
jgi:hypothetical protein